ncbi:MAG: hypothetical protein WA476_12955 [Acidobacteriaceae bacterium]
MPDGYCPACGRTPAPPPAPGAKPRIGWISILRLSIVAINLCGIVAAYWLRGRQPQPQYVHHGPVAKVDELKGSGRIYLVQMGDTKPHIPSQTSPSGCTQNTGSTCACFRP